MSAKIPNISDPFSAGLSTSDIINIAKNINPFDYNFRKANNSMRKDDSNATLDTPDVSGLVPSRPTPTTSISNESQVDKNLAEKSPDSDQPPRKSSSNLSLKIPETATSQPEMMRDIASMLNSDTAMTPELNKLINQVSKEGAGAEKPPGTADLVRTVLDMQCGKNPGPSPKKNLVPIANPAVAQVSSTTNTSVPVSVVPLTVPNMSNIQQVICSGKQIHFIPIEGMEGKFAAMQNTSNTLMPTMEHSRPTSNCSSSDDAMRHDYNKHMNFNDYGHGDDSDKRREMLERNKAAAVRYRKRKREEHNELKYKMKHMENEKLALETKVNVLSNELVRLQNLLAQARTICSSCKGPVNDATGTSAPAATVQLDMVEQAHTSQSFSTPAPAPQAAVSMTKQRYPVLLMPDGTRQVVQFLQTVDDEEEPTNSMETEAADTTLQVPHTTVTIKDSTIL